MGVVRIISGSRQWGIAEVLIDHMIDCENCTCGLLSADCQDLARTFREQTKVMCCWCGAPPPSPDCKVCGGSGVATVQPCANAWWSSSETDPRCLGCDDETCGNPVEGRMVPIAEENA